MEIVTLDEGGFARAIDDLAVILVDAVDSGASVGFVEPFMLDDARRWWRSLGAEVKDGRVMVLLARVDGRAVGTAQLRVWRSSRTLGTAPRSRKCWCVATPDAWAWVPH